MSSGSEARQKFPAIPGWFTMDESGKIHLIGARCKSCGDYFFPPTKFCGNPSCMSDKLEEAHLSREGTLYTYTINFYQPPPPYIHPKEPFSPFALGYLKLEKEKMLVPGQIIADIDLNTLKIGMKMEIVLDLLHKDSEGNDVMVWKFKPV